jgi:hypothetical protein
VECGGAGGLFGRCEEGDEEYEDSCLLEHVSAPILNTWDFF